MTGENKSGFKLVDRFGVPVQLGSHVSVKYVSGKYGQTAMLHGFIENIDQYGGAKLKLTQPASVAGRQFMEYKKIGDATYVCLPKTIENGVLKGYHKSRDFEHGCETWFEVTPIPDNIDVAAPAP